jgi:hypothetical protein
MVSRNSVRLPASVDLIAFANVHFAELMKHPDHREDALQELRIVSAFLPQATDAEKRRVARRVLSWLQYDLGVVAAKPRCQKPSYAPLPELEEGSFLNDLSDRLEAARMYERAA